MSNNDVEAGAGAGASGVPEDPPPREGLAMISESTPMERATTGLAGIAVATAAASCILVGGTVVYAASALSGLIAPYAAYQQTKLTDIAALKETHEKVQAEVDRLELENKRLGASVEDLGATVDRLEDVENALDQLTATQGQNISAFAEQVEENKDILAQMKKNLRANVLQNLLSVIIRCDSDGSFTIDDEETDGLIKRIKTINGVMLHEDRFREAIRKSGGSLNAVIDVVKNLLSDKVKEGEEIFSIKES
uniref:Uncharacterized protein n=1 Tax=Proboscia inermis TaxID=420281 RepID=A0A7S0C303_9STRA|mmetsp:Transcript_23775/g.24234  ORF Transcript_23775/g.24234 Transcript_23775/m.24234 type:complete len:251 (+) Transcript_23775:46-798(+)|eukprot:CAMPEP_0171313138 /NCGR_PEP_ID=MMETSP0816-20121228/38322_1 /TAXON_ID=420281 /ORGANISM="Proboscia inermis, Strain CCAP1064/1" /LENGTH=250 /DNA_ID=CAMNT_0011800013 /DNA_START=43 /DNA_END=795 /DNA_ORIENTATION=+